MKTREHTAAEPMTTEPMTLAFDVTVTSVRELSPNFRRITFDLALSHGTHAVCAKNFVDVGMIQGAALGDYASAYRLGKVAFRMVERYDTSVSPYFDGETYGVYKAAANLWTGSIA